MRSLITPFLLTVLSLPAVNAQTSKNPFRGLSTDIVKTYSIGDKVPVLQFNNLVNYPRSAATSADVELNGKIIIIDFWEKGCSACVAAFPKIEKLQEQFKDKVQVITVTSLSPQHEVLDYLKKLPVTKDVKLPVVVKDEILHKQFPYEFISHVVWIGADRTVKAITGTEHITEDHINEMIRKETVDWPVKIDILGFDPNKPFFNFANENIKAPALKLFSSFTGPVPGVSPLTRIAVDSSENIMVINAFNTPLLDLCKAAIKGEITGDLAMKEVVLNVSDPARYDAGKTAGNAWIAKGVSESIYSYNAIVPVHYHEEQVRQFIRKDLAHWLDAVLGITVRLDTIQMPALVIVKKGKTTPFKLTDNSGTIDKVDLSDSTSRFINYRMADLVNHFNNTDDKYHIADETGIDVNARADVELPVSKHINVPELSKAISKYGLDIVVTTRPVAMYVITESGKTSTVK